MGFRLGIDVGGTFTAFLLVDQLGEVSVRKSPSTPARPADGVLEGLRKLGQEHLSSGALQGLLSE